MSRFGGERVLVVTRALFEELGAFQGLNTDPDRYLPALLDPANNFFLDREAAENDPLHKQVIPYAIFRHGGRFLRYVRGTGSGEQRLAAKASIGIGGHINASDYAAEHLGQETYHNGVTREIAEELALAGPYSHRIVALLNDDSNEVGQVHLGVVHLVDLASPDVRPNEDTITDLTFLTPEELRAEAGRLETWSQFALGILDGG
jgi:predicted NUDIX family phosphoesterase